MANGTARTASNSPQSGALARRRTTGLENVKSTVSRKVDFHSNALDFKCALLASLGWTTNAIMEETGLTQGQVAYRIGKYELGRQKGDLTQRASYRQGTSPIARSVAHMFTRRDSSVNKIVVRTLNQKGLYAPKPTGVLKNET